MQAQKELDFLQTQLKSAKFDDTKSAKSLLNLKLIARTPANAPCVYRLEGLRTLSQIAFDLDKDGKKQHEASSLEAARIIANALLLQPGTQQMFADLGYMSSLVKFYSQSSANHEFVGARILFLLTYQSNVDFDDLVEHQRLVEHIEKHLLHHISTRANTSIGSSQDPMISMALNETLKLIYNAMDKCTTQVHAFTPLTSSLITLLNEIPLPAPNPLDPPIPQLLNALGMIEWPPTSTSTSNSTNETTQNLNPLATKLIQILDKSISSLSVAELETQLIAPLTILRKIVHLCHEATNNQLRIALLPQDIERDKPLGQSSSLASRLLQLQTSAGVMVLPEAISGLLFDLSGQDAATFIRNIGYGHAAGYLMTHRIPLPEGVMNGAQSTRGNGAAEVDVNPITGQRFASESQVPAMPEMTEEEKEREAERLFVLFERLKATGVVNVENPVTRARQEGRFEELSDGEE